MSGQTAVSFLEACGAAAPLRFCVVRPGVHPRQFETGRPFVRVGRDLKSDVVLQHPDVSRSHTYLQIICGRLLCLDLASRTGIRWNAGRAAWGWVDKGDSVAIGPFQVHLHWAIEVVPGCPPPPKNPLKSSPPEADSLPAVTLEFLNAEKGPQSARLTRRVTLVGRAPICKISFDDSSVARVHCSLVLTPHGVYAVNLVRRGGIQVNDEPVVYTRLEDGDQLRIGKFSARLHYESEPTKGAQLAAINTATQYTPSREKSVVAARAVNHSRSNQLILRPLSVRDAPAGYSLPAVTSATLPKLFTPEQAGPILPLDELSGDGLVRALVGQMTSFHQQMFEQNQQTISMIVQLFSRMHREHVELVHDELARMQQLTEEFRLVQRELARASTGGSRSEPKPRPTSQGTVADALTAIAAAPSPNSTTLERLPDDVCLAGADVSNLQSDDSTSDATPPQAHVAGVPSRAAAAPAAIIPAAPAAATRDTVPVAPSSSPVPLALTNPDEIHVWLVDRMAAIEAEQQTLWQRIFNALKLP